jgi:hypothetical protein
MHSISIKSGGYIDVDSPWKTLENIQQESYLSKLAFMELWTKKLILQPFTLCAVLCRPAAYQPGVKFDCGICNLHDDHDPCGVVVDGGVSLWGNTGC